MKILNIVYAIVALVPFGGFTGNISTLNLSGTLIAPPVCVINDSTPIVVDFGNNININEVNGINNAKVINYSLSCEENITNSAWSFGLTMTGVATFFDEAAVLAIIDGSSSKELGVRINLDGKPFKLNQRTVIQGEMPVLEAVPVQAAGVTLPAGSFHATTSLLADYN